MGTSKQPPKLSTAVNSKTADNVKTNNKAIPCAESRSTEFATRSHAHAICKVVGEGGSGGAGMGVGFKCTSFIALNNEGVSHYDKGEYDVALRYFQEAHAVLELRREESVKDNVYQSPSKESTTDRSRSHTGNKNTQQIEEKNMGENVGGNAKTSITLSSFDSKESIHPVPTTSYIYQRMDFDEGLHAFSSTQCLSKKSSHDSFCSLAIIYFNLGQTRRRLNDLEKAAELYAKARHELLPHLILSGSSSNGSKSNTKFDSKTTSCPPNTKVDCTDRNEGQDDEQSQAVIVHILHNIGQLQYRKGNLLEAMATFSLALLHGKQILGETNLDVAATLNSLGVLHYHTSNESADKAMELFQQALDIRRQKLGSKHQDVATCLNNIGRIHVQRDEFEEALVFYDEALQIRRSQLGMHHLDYAATAFNAGQSLHQNGELDRAMELYQEFLRKK